MGRTVRSEAGLRLGRTGAASVLAGHSSACATDSSACAGCASGARCAVLAEWPGGGARGAEGDARGAGRGAVEGAGGAGAPLAR